MHYPDLNPLCLFKLHDNYPETGGLLVERDKRTAALKALHELIPVF